MAWSVDARIPLTILASEAALAAALAEAPSAATLRDFDTSSPHAPGCACCVGRAPVALALDSLFQARVRGSVPWFPRVLALAETEAARAALTAALREDALTAARFRLG